MSQLPVDLDTSVRPGEALLDRLPVGALGQRVLGRDHSTRSSEVDT
jgi:hypothetical protein